MPSPTAQRVSRAIHDIPLPKRNTALQVARYSPVSHTIVAASTGTTFTWEKLNHTVETLQPVADNTPARSRTSVKLRISTKSAVALLAATTLATTPFGAVLAAIFRDAAYPEILVWPIYAAIPGAVIGVSILTYVKHSLYRSAMAILNRIADVQDQSDFHTRYPDLFHDDRYIIAVERYRPQRKKS